MIFTQRYLLGLISSTICINDVSYLGVSFNGLYESVCPPKCPWMKTDTYIRNLGIEGCSVEHKPNPEWSSI